MNVIIPCQPDRNGIEICLHESNVNYSGVNYHTLISNGNWFEIIEVMIQMKLQRYQENDPWFDQSMIWWFINITFILNTGVSSNDFYWNDAI